MTARPPAFRLGLMRDRIKVQTFTEADDTNGQTIRTWSTLLNKEPSQFIPTSGGETIRGKQIEAGINAVFEVRFREAKYTPEQRIIFGGLTYGIVYVRDFGRRYTWLQCKAVTGG